MGRVGSSLVVVVALASAACTGKSTKTAATDDAAAAVVELPPAWQPTAVVIADIGVHSVAPAQRCAIDEAALTRALAEQLGSASGFYPNYEAVPSGVPSDRADIKAAITYEVIFEDGVHSIMAAIEIVVEWRSFFGVAPHAGVLVERIVGSHLGDTLCKAVTEHVGAALEAAGNELIDKNALRTGPAELVVAALASTDPDNLLWALVLVRERKLAAGFDRVIALVDSQSRDVRETAVGALIALGDQRAVPILAKKAEMSDYEFLRLVIEAVSAIGGEEAISFLEFVASGHPDDDIRKRAEQGLARIDRKAGKPRQ